MTDTGYIGVPHGHASFSSRPVYNILILFLAPSRLYAQGFWALGGTATPGPPWFHIS
jgi:hypothetical protein